uniref:Uncharacterized protein n=1 Tax=Rhizophagus irregularis (strain DAOM 181602 / DAOM 197198 / MUCL 43194) TaxID=747089 RepID=U9SVQ5_RHIID
MNGGHLCKLVMCKFTRGQVRWYWNSKESVNEKCLFEKNIITAFNKYNIMIEIELTCRLCREIEENPESFTIKIERRINDVIYIEHDHLELWKVKKVKIDVLEKLEVTELVSKHWEEQPGRKHFHVIVCSKLIIKDRENRRLKKLVEKIKKLTDLSLSDGNISVEVITNHTSIDDEEKLMSDCYRQIYTFMSYDLYHQWEWSTSALENEA